LLASGIITRKLLNQQKNQTMRYLFAALSLLFVSNFIFAQDNLIIEVSGRVTDQEKQLPLPDVSVQVKGTIAGTITN